MDPSALTLDSRKEQLAKGWSYLLGAMDLHAALAPRITHAAVLQVRGEARQASWVRPDASLPEPDSAPPPRLTRWGA